MSLGEPVGGFVKMLQQLPAAAFLRASEPGLELAADPAAVKRKQDALRRQAQPAVDRYIEACASWGAAIAPYLADLYRHSLTRVQSYDPHRLTPRERQEFEDDSVKAAIVGTKAFRAATAKLTQDDWLRACPWMRSPTEDVPDPLRPANDAATAPLIRLLRDFGFGLSASGEAHGIIAQPRFHSVFAPDHYPPLPAVMTTYHIDEHLTSQRPVVSPHPVRVTWIAASGAARALPDIAIYSVGKDPYGRKR